MFGLAVGACGLEFARAMCSSVRLCCVLFSVLLFRCLVLFHAAHYSAACFLVLSCAVLHAACVFHWLCAFIFVMFCVNMRLMSLLFNCVVVSCFAHG